MAKHKYIETPEKMWELFEAYKSWVKSNPRYKVLYVGKDGRKVDEPLERPLTHEGFRTFGHENGVSIEPYFANTDNSYTEYLTICSRIKDCIRQDQIEGGMVGQYNPSITQRLNGLTEKSELKQNIEIEKLPDWITKPIE